MSRSEAEAAVVGGVGVFRLRGCSASRSSHFAQDDNLYRAAAVNRGLALIKGFPYYGCMNITLSLDDDLVREVRKIAVERDTTLTGLVRAHLQELAAEHAKSGRKRRELEALRESFEKYQFNMGKRTWKREDLHERR